MTVEAFRTALPESWWKRRWGDHAPATEHVTSTGLPRIAALIGGTSIDLEALARAEAEALQSLDAVGAAVVACNENGDITDIATTATSAEMLGHLGPLVISGEFPLFAALRGGSEMWLSTRDMVRTKFPDFARLPVAWEAYAAAPLRVNGKLVGATAIPFGNRRRFGETERVCVRAVFALAAEAIGAKARCTPPTAVADVSPLLHGVHDAVIVTDEINNRVVFVNDAVADTIGIDEATLRSSSLSELVERFECECLDPDGPTAPAGVGCAMGVHRWRFRDATGAPRVIEIHNGSLDSRGRRVSVIIDITDREESTRERITVAQQETLWQERDRLARDLHDGVVQSVFATSLTLAAAALRAPEPVRIHIEEAIDGLDTIVQQLRTTVFELGRASADLATLRRLTEEMANKSSRSLGFRPTVRFSGCVDEIDDPLLLSNIAMALREMLSNIARHAHATAVDIAVSVDAAHVMLTVADNGVGFDRSASAGDGLGNLERRALSLAGSCDLESSPGSGTTIRWQVARDAA